MHKTVDNYLAAKNILMNAGFDEEIRWQNELSFSGISETDLLRESAWVILSSGMRETVIRMKFPSFSEAFFDWSNAKLIITQSNKCERRAKKIFNHHGKIKAILKFAEVLNRMGCYDFKATLRNEGVSFIRTLPYMGPATSYHFAKNIGLNEVKPDRHLSRVAQCAGYENPRLLCEDISRATGDKISVVDLVIWRFATVTPNYIEYFTK